MRRRKPSAAPERPVDTESLFFHHSSYIIGDSVEFKEARNQPWRKAHVVGLGFHAVTVEPKNGGNPVTIHFGHRGRIRKPHGGAAAQLPRELDPEDQARARARLQADGTALGDLPPITPVLLDGSPLRAVPKPPPPARDPEYIAYVQQHACSSCSAEAPSESHHQGLHGMGIKCSDYRCVPLCHLCHQTFTATGALPGRDRAASLALMQEMQVELLTRWAEFVAQRAAVEAARVARVPLLRLVAAAACLAIFFCLGMTGCGETRSPSYRSDRGELLKPGRFCQEHQQEGAEECLPIAADHREEGEDDAGGLSCLGRDRGLFFSGRTGNHANPSWPDANQRRRTVHLDESTRLPYTGLSLGLDLLSVSPGLPEALDGACYTEGASRACVSSGNFAAPSWGAALYFHGGLLHEHSYEKAPSYHVVTSAEQGPSAGVAHV